MVLDCVAKANPDHDLVMISPLALNNAGDTPEDFVTMTIEIKAAGQVVSSVVVDSSYRREDGAVFVIVNHPSYLTGLVARVSAQDEAGDTFEIDVPVAIGERTRFATKSLPDTPTPDVDTARD